MCDKDDCLYSKRVDHKEHGSWHENVCKLLGNLNVGNDCPRYISKTPSKGIYQKDVIKQLEGLKND